MINKIKRTMKRFLLTLILLGTFMVCQAQRIHYEVYYQNFFSESIDGVTEVYLPDRTRVDILTDDFAIEVDFANKWAESIGQALFYGKMTGKRPAVLLIMENQSKDEKYLKRLVKVAGDYDIKVWVINTDLNWSVVKITKDIYYEY